MWVSFYSTINVCCRLLILDFVGLIPQKNIAMTNEEAIREKDLNSYLIEKSSQNAIHYVNHIVKVIGLEVVKEKEDDENSYFVMCKCLDNGLPNDYHLDVIKSYRHPQKKIN